MNRLTVIKILHTIIWIFYNLIIFYLLFAVLNKKIDYWVWIGIGLVLFEGVILLIFKNTCPLTIVARKYSNSSNANFDIFLPEWLARNNKLIYTLIFILIMIILMYKLFF